MGRQVFVVCPLIDDSEKSDQKSVLEEVKRLKQGAFKHRRIGTLHGKMKDEEKAEVMQRFASLIESQLQQLAAQGLVPQRSYRALALAFVGGVHELEIDWLLAQPHPAVDSVVDELWFILSTLLAGSQALMHQPG